MTTFARQVCSLCLVHLRMWWRGLLEAVVGVGLTTLYLLVANQVFNINLGEHLCVGVHSDRASLERNLLGELALLPVRGITYADPAAGRTALARGETVAMIACRGTDPITFELTLSGRNLLLDREIAAQGLRLALRLADRESRHVITRIENDWTTESHITTFMTASLLAFLLWTLAMINNGAFLIRHGENRTLQTFLASPASRWTLVVAQMLTGSLLSTAILAAAVACCRLFVPWPLPEPLLPWVGVLLLQVFAANGIFLALGVLCRGHRMYVSISAFLLMVMVFVSGAVAPVEMMPVWERALAHGTPIFYQVRSMRAAMLGIEPLRAGDLWNAALWGLAGCIVGYLRLSLATLARRE